ncbi:hypothetical protein HOY80DRAFT_1048221 [Tuber brumale]|nr:hypothetical protein HOY80DRAFT_1048221 [Tuber brumale]
MLTTATDRTSNFHLTEHNMLGDLDRMVYEEWEEGEEDEDVDFEGDTEGDEWEQEGEDEEEEVKVVSQMFIKSEDHDHDVMEKWDSQDNGFRSSMQKKRFLAGKTHRIVDLEASAREDALE